MQKLERKPVGHWKTPSDEQTDIPQLSGLACPPSPRWIWSKMPFRFTGKLARNTLIACHGAVQ